MEYYLEGKARMWFEINEDKFTSWKELEQLFTSKFAGRQQEYNAWVEIQNIRQEPGEDIDMLSYRLGKLAKNAKITDEQMKIKYLWNAITPEKRRLLIKGEVQTYESAINTLREEEDIDMLSGVVNTNTVNNLTYHGSSNDARNKNCTEMEVLIEKFDSLNVNVMDFMKANSQNNQRYGNRNNNQNHNNYFNKNKDQFSNYQQQDKRNYQRNTYSNYDNGDRKPEVKNDQEIHKSVPNNNAEVKEINCLEVEVEPSELYMAEKRKNAEETNAQAGTAKVVKILHSNTEGNDSEPMDTDHVTSIPEGSKRPSTSRVINTRSAQSSQKSASSSSNNDSKSYSLVEDLGRVKANISLPQLIEISPIVKSQLESFYNNIAKVRAINSICSEKVTNCRTTIEILGTECLTVLDTGAACSVISRLLVEKLQYKVDASSAESIITADGARHNTLGKIHNLPIKIAEELFDTEVIIMNIPNNILILGIDWMRKYKANMDVQKQKITISKQYVTVELPFTTDGEVQVNRSEKSSYKDIEIFGI
ncbi:hypothetical protein AX774_g3457 [Zancudomyces culisetae]|uniref:Retrotransposon gag domain-containing protein n=1 Tax=Zancudomyces culisetae TaxID=1213189 RepID=A0A1R1PQ91_ZANCU|nr:hypothetical protein AX774_g3457 [Zancudomyces culisetae]|eukprot:OMH83042.1 hypothetical protein AX774_g3457 [Zancudomyces culisetae]